MTTYELYWPDIDDNLIVLVMLLLLMSGSGFFQVLSSLAMILTLGMALKLHALCQKSWQL